MLEKILNVLFPPVCGFCGNISKDYLCKNCELEIEEYKIAKIINCSNIKKSNINYLINMLTYQGNIRKLLIQYKFNEKSYLYKTFAKIILKDTKICSFLKKYDIILPVPLYKSKYNIRGYNQTALIAKEIANKLQMDIEIGNLIKVRNTSVQSTLNKDARRKNVKDAFKVINSDILYGKSIIIFDDIYTTGSTIQECARIIKKAGAKNILALTIAKD